MKTYQEWALRGLDNGNGCVPEFLIQSCLTLSSRPICHAQTMIIQSRFRWSRCSCCRPVTVHTHTHLPPRFIQCGCVVPKKGEQRTDRSSGLIKILRPVTIPTSSVSLPNYSGLKVDICWLVTRPLERLCVAGIYMCVCSGCHTFGQPAAKRCVFYVLHTCACNYTCPCMCVYTTRLEAQYNLISHSHTLRT